MPKLSSSRPHLIYGVNQDSLNPWTIAVLPASQCPWKPHSLQLHFILVCCEEKCLWSSTCIVGLIKGKFPLSIVFSYFVLFLMAEDVDFKPLKVALGPIENLFSDRSPNLGPCHALECLLTVFHLSFVLFSGHRILGLWVSSSPVVSPQKITQLVVQDTLRTQVDTGRELGEVPLSQLMLWSQVES